MLRKTSEIVAELRETARTEIIAALLNEAADRLEVATNTNDVLVNVARKRLRDFDAEDQALGAEIVETVAFVIENWDNTEGMKMFRKTSEIVADLRDIATGHDADGQETLGNILREAADRLDKARSPVSNSRLVDARYKGEYPLIDTLPVGLMKAAQAFDAGAQWHAQAIEDGRL